MGPLSLLAELVGMVEVFNLVVIAVVVVVDFLRMVQILLLTVKVVRLLLMVVKVVI